MGLVLVPQGPEFMHEPLWLELLRPPWVGFVLIPEANLGVPGTPPPKFKMVGGEEKRGQGVGGKTGSQESKKDTIKLR